MRTTLRNLFTISFLLLFSACSVQEYFGPERDTKIEDSNKVADVPSGTRKLGMREGDLTTLRGPQLPWKLWISSKDLAGQPLTSLLLLEGDELFDRERYREALVRYREAREVVTARNEKDALIIREASTQLALNSPEKALRVLSTYFRQTGRAEESVTAPFSLLFAYAYGSRGDVDQALAWFSRTNRLHAGLGGFHESAQNGTRALLRVPSTFEVQQLGNKWKTDSFVSLLIGQELRRRSFPDYVEPTTKSFARFWQPTQGVYVAPAGVMPIGDGARTVIGVILPLSGKHAPLGQKVKNGIELAYLGQEAEQDFILEFRDSTGDPVRAVSLYREFVNANTPAVVLGPLLSEAAISVAEAASTSSLPVLVFSKRSSFQTGDRVFRLGPTLQSQVTSLLQKANKGKGMRRFILITPYGAIGEFYRSVFELEAANLGAEVVYQGSYTPGSDSELVALAAEVDLLDADALFFPGSLKEASRFAGNLSRQQRTRLPLLGLGTWDNPGELKKSRSILNGALFVSPYNAKSEREVIQKFQTAYSRKYGTQPDFLAAQGFDAGTLVIAAYRQAQLLSLPFEEGLRTVDQYEGLTGMISVSPSGELERTFEVLQLKDGARQLVRIPEYSEPVTPSYVFRGDNVINAPKAPEKTPMAGGISQVN